MATQILPQTTLQPDDYTLSLLERFADRLASEPGMIAHAIAQTGITAADLDIDRRQFARLRLCLLPRTDTLEQDIATIAAAATVSTDVVRKVVQS